MEDTASSAEIVLACGFSKIEVPSGFFRESTISLGKELAIAHITNVREEEREGIIYITCRCQRSMNLSETPYILELQLQPGCRRLLEGRCSCQAGIDAKCKHSAGLVHFVNTEQVESCTSGEKKWGKPPTKAKDLFPKGETVQELQGNHSSLPSSFRPNKEALESWSKDMRKFGLTHSGVYKLFNADTSTLLSSHQHTTDWKSSFPTEQVSRLKVLFQDKEAIAIHQPGLLLFSILHYIELLCNIFFIFSRTWPNSTTVF